MLVVQYTSHNDVFNGWEKLFWLWHQHVFLMFLKNVFQSQLIMVAI